MHGCTLNKKNLAEAQGINKEFSQRRKVQIKYLYYLNMKYQNDYKEIRLENQTITLRLRVSARVSSKLHPSNTSLSLTRLVIAKPYPRFLRTFLS